MPPCVPLEKALTLSLGTFKQPIVTRYQLALLVFRLYQSREFRGQPLCVQKDFPDIRDFNRTLNDLLNSGVLSESRGLPARSVFAILGKEEASASELACSIDPFAYLSHLSAMDFHGLTDRLPKILYVSTPPPVQWKKFAQEKMAKDCGDEWSIYRTMDLPKLTRIRINKIKGQTVHIHACIHLGAFKHVRNSVLRVATIGRTFLDMIRRPDLCGGIRHVIEVYKGHASTYLTLITAEIDAHGAPIDKIRAGYILEEMCSLSDPVVAGWQRYVQRGGSRKLDAASEYSPHYSERWCLSINIEGA